MRQGGDILYAMRMFLAALDLAVFTRPGFSQWERVRRERGRSGRLPAYQHPFRLRRFGSGAPGLFGRGIIRRRLYEVRDNEWPKCGKLHEHNIPRSNGDCGAYLACRTLSLRGNWGVFSPGYIVTRLAEGWDNGHNCGPEALVARLRAKVGFVGFMVCDVGDRR